MQVTVGNPHYKIWQNVLLVLAAIRKVDAHPYPHLPLQLVLTAGADGVMQVWRHRGPASATTAPPSSGSSGITVRVVAVGQLDGGASKTGSGISIPESVTSMVACRRSGRLIPQAVIATASGALLIVSMESALQYQATGEAAAAGTTLPGTDEAAGATLMAEAEEEPLSIRTCWELRPFAGAPISAVAMSPRGDCCAAACASRGQVAFFRVATGGLEVTMQLLGYYAVKEPRLLAFAPESALAGAAPPLMPLFS